MSKRAPRFGEKGFWLEIDPEIRDIIKELNSSTRPEFIWRTVQDSCAGYGPPTKYGEKHDFTRGWGPCKDRQWGMLAIAYLAKSNEWKKFHRELKKLATVTDDENSRLSKAEQREIERYETGRFPVAVVTYHFCGDSWDEMAATWDEVRDIIHDDWPRLEPSSGRMVTRRRK